MKVKVWKEKQQSTTVNETEHESVVTKIENVTSKTTAAVERKAPILPTIVTRIMAVVVQEIIDIMKKTSTIHLIVTMEMAIETLDHVIDDEFHPPKIFKIRQNTKDR